MTPSDFETSLEEMIKETLDEVEEEMTTFNRRTIGDPHYDAMTDKEEGEAVFVVHGFSDEERGPGRLDRYDIYHVNENMEEPERIFNVETELNRNYHEAVKDGADPDYSDIRVDLYEIRDDGVLAEIPTDPEEGIRAKKVVTWDGEIRDPDFEEFEEAARQYVDNVGPSLGNGDYTQPPEIPDSSEEVAAVRKIAGGNGTGYDAIYVVGRDDEGNLHHREVRNTRFSNAYASIRDVEDTGDEVRVTVSVEGEEEEYPVDKAELGVE